MSVVGPSVNRAINIAFAVRTKSSTASGRIAGWSSTVSACRALWMATLTVQHFVLRRAYGSTPCAPVGPDASHSVNDWRWKVVVTADFVGHTTYQFGKILGSQSHLLGEPRVFSQS